MNLTSVPVSARLGEPLFCIACHVLGCCALLSVATGWTTRLVQGSAMCAVILVALALGSAPLQRKILRSFQDFGKAARELGDRIFPPGF